MRPRLNDNDIWDLCFIVALTAMVFFAGCGSVRADNCTGPGSQTAYTNLCRPSLGSTNWGSDMNNNLISLDALFAGTSGLGGHTHDGTNGEGPAVNVTSVTNAVQGPASATDNALCRFDGTTGMLIQNSAPTLSDSGELAFLSTQGVNLALGYLVIPQGTSCASVTGLGRLCFDNDDLILYAGTGSGIQAIGGTGSLGDVVGPGSATDEALVRFDSTTGKLVQASAITLTDAGVMVFGSGEQISILSGAIVEASAGAIVFPQGTSCSSVTGLGRGCFDNDDMIFYLGDGSAAQFIGGATSVRGPASATDNALVRFDATTGKLIQNSNITLSDAGEMAFLSTTGVNAALGYIVLPQGTSCSSVTGLGRPCFDNDDLIEYIGDGSAAVPIGGKVTKSIYAAAGGFDVDGTQCTEPARRQINSGPRKKALNCADNNSSVFEFSLNMPDAWNAGTITVEPQIENENATPSGNWVADFSCQCRGDSDAINSTWGTAQTVTIALDTQYDEEHATSAAITPNGGCAAGDSLYCRGVIVAASTTTQMADTYVLGVKVEYGVSGASD